MWGAHGTCGIYSSQEVEVTKVLSDSRVDKEDVGVLEPEVAVLQAQSGKADSPSRPQRAQAWWWRTHRMAEMSNSSSLAMETGLPLRPNDPEPCIVPSPSSQYSWMALYGLRP